MGMEVNTLKRSPELWRPLKDRDDYMISNTGKVKSYHKQWKRWIEKSTRIDHKGYMTVGITTGDVFSSSVFVHRLVAEAFIPNPNNLPYINHKDNNPLNNDASNLEWCTPKYNMQHSFKVHGRVSGQAKPVALYINDELFSYYSSVEHCSKLINNNKKVFSIDKGRTTLFDNMLRIVEVDCETDLLPLNKKIFDKPLRPRIRHAIKYNGVYYESVKDFAEKFDLSERTARWYCYEKREYEGIKVDKISIREYLENVDRILF